MARNENDFLAQFNRLIKHWTQEDELYSNCRITSHECERTMEHQNINYTE